jgi:ribosomal protein L32
MPLTPADKTARHRLRLAGNLPALPTCPQCGRTVISDRTAPLCSQCWKQSPEGKEWNRERVARQRSRTPSSGDQA